MSLLLELNNQLVGSWQSFQWSQNRNDFTSTEGSKGDTTFYMYHNIKSPNWTVSLSRNFDISYHFLTFIRLDLPPTSLSNSYFYPSWAFLNLV
jgi:hypothetical protein